MALYIFNFSIDSQDALPDYMPEDLAFNDIESFAEFTLECVLGIDNAVAEHDEQDPESGGSFDFQKSFLVSGNKDVNVIEFSLIRSLHSSSFINNLLIDRSDDIHSPPPKA